MIKRPGFLKKSPALYHPFLLRIVVALRQFERRLCWLFDKRQYAGIFQAEQLQFRIKKHQSVLIRKLSNDEDKELQYNKVDNLKVVIRQLDGVLIRPGETFSFCKLVGKPTLKRGFKKGMELTRGVARPGVGGGICQSSNLIYWLVLHTPLEIVERHHHSFDPFPDKGRVLPFASGATVMYNYRDLQFFNGTDKVYQLRLWLDDKCLNGELRACSEQEFTYNVYEKNHRFEEKDGVLYRGNELWRRVIDKKSGVSLKHQFLVSNYAEVKYQPSPEKLQADTSVVYV